MSAYDDNLLKRRDAVAAELADIENKSMQTNSREYTQKLYDELERIDKLLSSPNSKYDRAERANQTTGSWTIYEYGEP